MMDQGSVVEQGTCRTHGIEGLLPLPATRRITVTVKVNLPINASRERQHDYQQWSGLNHSPSVTPAHKRPAYPQTKKLALSRLVPTDLISPCSSNNLPFGHGRFSGIDGRTTTVIVWACVAKIEEDSGSG